MEDLLFFFAFSMAVAGIVLFLKGWRGAQVDDHGVCAACGYDLTGRPLQGNICTECGADLNANWSKVRGHRQRRWGLVGWGLAMLLPGWWVVFMFTGIIQFDWKKREPVGWLVWEVEHE